ncbi:hypothetical protein EDD27_5367 [Nonomuraea polychroma]|uniref:Uncharacterized protein n=1 Tax=Nonomuraea polychroma TaxID=46176 RepID=A0A438MAF7_9ACTN|nr:hypothetical protein EDD27_5367 [Nonomuraea polychroma]
MPLGPRVSHLAEAANLVMAVRKRVVNYLEVPLDLAG